MSTSVSVILDTRREKADGTFPISFRIVHNRKSTTINTGYSVRKKYWDEKKSAVKKGSKHIPGYAGFNYLLDKRKLELKDKIIELDEKGILDQLSIKELKQVLLEKYGKSRKKITIKEYGNGVIEELRSLNKLGNVTAYRQALSFLERQTGNPALTFEQLSFQTLNRIEATYMADPEHHYNGLSVYLRTIRALFNRAIADGVVSERYYPFKRTRYEKNKYQIKNEKTKKRALTKEAIQKIEKFQHENAALMSAKYYFLFSFYTMGMNFVDMAKLKKHNISGNVLTYKRTKTGRTYNIPLNRKAMDILHYFDYEEKNDVDYLFPIIAHVRGGEKKKYDAIKGAIKRTNKRLKTIAGLLDMEGVKLTTYVSRHTWATLADHAGIDRKLISKGLGHTNLHTTDIYIAEIENIDALADANDIITGD